MPGDRSQRPQRPAMAILGPLWLQPPAIETHEIAEPLGIRIEGVLHKRGERQDDVLRKLLLAEGLE